MRRLKILLILSLFILFITGCHVSRELIKLSDVEYYELGLKRFEDKKYDEARKDFEKVYNYFPASELAPKALIKLADSYFYEKSYTDASVEYKLFLELYPTNENATHASYRLSLSRYNRILTIDRDQTNTLDTIAAIKEFLFRFPDAPEAKELQKLLAECYNRLAEHNFYVGRFYLKTKKYDAALKRFEKVLVEFPEYTEKAKLWFYIGETHFKSDKLKDAKIAYQKALEFISQGKEYQAKIEKRLKELRNF